MGIKTRPPGSFPLPREPRVIRTSRISPLAGCDAPELIVRHNDQALAELLADGVLTAGKLTLVFDIAPVLG